MAALNRVCWPFSGHSHTWSTGLHVPFYCQRLTSSFTLYSHDSDDEDNSNFQDIFVQYKGNNNLMCLQVSCRLISPAHRNVFTLKRCSQGPIKSSLILVISYNLYCSVLLVMLLVIPGLYSHSECQNSDIKKAVISWICDCKVVEMNAYRIFVTNCLGKRPLGR
jgi:hypothetical protein